MKSYYITDVGKKRQINQDFVFCSEEPVGNLPNLFIVADGMGGHSAGDFASRFCVEVFVKQVQGFEHGTPISIMAKALESTNHMLIEKANSDPSLNGMGTTFVAATIIHDVMYVANVGDSRLYLIQDKITQVTEDHSLVEEMVRKGELLKEEAKYHPNKNIVTRALGANMSLVPDYFEVNINSNSTILLCSDGLNNMVDDSEILAVVKECEDNLEQAGKALVGIANDNGGKDNISLVMVKL